MIKERYCSFEISKLLRKKGFNVGSSKYPTPQMARDWLRKEHYIYADPIKQGNYNDCSEYYSWIVARMGIIYRNPTVVDKLSYEDAVEAALKYSLEKLI